MQKKLDQIRDKIDKIDKEIICQLEDRLNLVKEVSKLKQENLNICFIKAKREAEMVKNLITSTNKISSVTIFQIWRQIISLSLQTEREFEVNFYSSNIDNDNNIRIIREYFSALTKINKYNNKSLLKNTHKAEDVIILDKKDNEQYEFLLKNQDFKIFARLPDIDPSKNYQSSLNAIAKLDVNVDDFENIIILSSQKIGEECLKSCCKINIAKQKFCIYELTKNQYKKLKNKYEIKLIGGFSEVFT
ncbi:MAG: chorismate mutase [Rickettsiales bacterium]|nr:chorismate mutase [Rickettsiales bacterium]